jgi:sulfatase modifying factor 1
MMKMTAMTIARNLLLLVATVGVALAAETPRPAKPAQPQTLVLPTPAAPAAANRPGFNAVYGIRMVWIPAGEFMMGSSKSESWHYPDETIHLVKITKPFYISATEITQTQYALIMRASPSRFQGPDLPVESVSWDEAVAFCRRLGPLYRLPTEAEWEYACRAGTDDKFYTGDNDMDLNKAAWLGGVSDAHTHPVAQLAPNNFGLYDMLGNVYEWVADYYDPGYYNRSPKEDPHGPKQGKERVIRGGAFSEAFGNCRCAVRVAKNFAAKQANLGFRIVCEMPPPRRKEATQEPAKQPAPPSTTPPTPAAK